MPKRIQVAYVRTIEPEAPPEVVAPPRPIAPPRPARRACAASAGACRVGGRARRARAAAAAAAAAAEAASESAAEAEAKANALAAVAEAASAAASALASAPRPRARRIRLFACRERVATGGRAERAATALAAAAPASSAASAADAFVWPRLDPASATCSTATTAARSTAAQVEWIRVGERYQVNVDLFAGPEFAPIFSRHMTSEGRIDASGLAPARYDEDTHFVMRDPRRMTRHVRARCGRPRQRRQARAAARRAGHREPVHPVHVAVLDPAASCCASATTVEFPLALPRSDEQLDLRRGRAADALRRRSASCRRST